MGKAPKELTITKEDIIRERDERKLSWAQVARNLELGNPGAARKAYAELTGRSHKDSKPIVQRAPKGIGNRRTETPLWDDDTDQEEIEAKLNGPWVEAEGEPGTKKYVPAHWAGSVIKVRRSVTGRTWYEEFVVSKADSFTYGPEGDQPLQVTVFAINSDRAKGTYTFRVQDILAVG